MMTNRFDFWQMENKEFEKIWKNYKDNRERLMVETPVARLGFENVEVYIALEKEDGNEYITIFTTVCEDGEWRTADFLSDETERNNKIKSALSEKNWNGLQLIMLDMLIDYCKKKKIAVEEDRADGLQNTLEYEKLDDVIKSCAEIVENQEAKSEKGSMDKDNER